MNPENENFKSGFVNIFGYPNVGKSTLMNQLTGERMSIITPKAQTTRHRIIGIVNSPEYQIVFSDTPGRIRQPAYKMQESMNAQITMALEDSDVAILMTHPGEKAADILSYATEIGKAEIPVFLVINKVDLVKEEELNNLIAEFEGHGVFSKVIPLSALHGQGVETLLNSIVEALPENPPYFPEDQLTDRSERFFVSEIIREKILELYHQEIPYAVEVVIEKFKEEVGQKGPFIHIEASIFVMRQSQKGILIGKGGSAIKQLGIDARKGIEEFLGMHVFLELFVKVKKDWRDDDRMLKYFGYKN